MYKAVEETVKALAVHFNLGEVLENVERRGRWTATELEKAVREVSRRLGDWFRGSWDTANYLNVRGFHEAKLDPGSVRDRLPDVERAVLEARRVVAGEV